MPAKRLSPTGESPLFVSPIPWNRENVLALLPLIKCEQCGDCCRLCTPIVAKDDELLRIADFLDIKASQLRKEWKQVGEVWHVPSKPCMYLKNNRCSVHPARMVVCKYFPLQRVNYHGQDCIAVSHFCEAGSECIKWLERKVNDHGVR